MLTLAALVIAACGSDGSGAAPTVEPAGALTAVVGWAVDGLEPVVDDAGDVEPPVVYIAAKSSDTIGAGVQAAVVEATTDTATVRFADDRHEAVDDNADKQPVKDDGIMLVVGEFPTSTRVVTLEVELYRALDDAASYVVEISAAPAGISVTSSQPV